MDSGEDVFFETTLVSRLKRLRETIGSMYADGDLTRRAVAEGKDEIAELLAQSVDFGDAPAAE